MGAAQDAFLNLLIAALTDAALEMKLCQLQTTIDPDGKGPRLVRIIVVPEAMEYRHPDGRPFGTEPAGVGICPKCGGQMAHYRLKGYQCSRCN